MNARKLVLHTDKGLPVVRAGRDGRGEIVLRGSSLTKGTRAENAAYVRRCLGTEERVRIGGKYY